MESIFNHGFVVQNSIIPLDLSSSKNNIPIIFIASLSSYVKVCDKINATSVIFWDFYDADRETFENHLFDNYEKRILKLKSTEQIKKYLKICKIMCRCSDPDEAIRIFSLLVDILLQNCNSQLIAEFLETVSITNDTFSKIFIDKDVSKYLEYILLHLCTARRDVFGFFSDSLMTLTDHNLVSQYFFLGHYQDIFVCVKYGLQWRFCENVFIEYCKALNSSWIVDDMLSQCEDNSSIERSFLILQTFFVVRGWTIDESQDRLEALLIAWKSIPDAFVTPKEMLASVRKFASPSNENEQELAAVCELYRRLFWDSRDRLSEPRSLADLCRCSVRHRLSENFQLPHGVSKLSVPERVQRFLKLEI